MKENYCKEEGLPIIEYPDKNLTGKRFGVLNVLGFAGHSGSVMAEQWFCECDCGNVLKSSRNLLLSGKKTSCGCMRVYHGRIMSRGDYLIYKIWLSMKDRVYNENSKYYPSYGGRGIGMCERWLLSFEDFMDDMGDRPGREYSVDRIDNNKGYEPGNCRWATRKEQCNNRRSNRVIAHNGKHRTISQWSEEVGIDASVLSRRKRLGWSNDDILGTPQTNHKGVTHNGRTQSVSEWAKETGIDAKVIYSRLYRKKWTIEKILSTPQGAGTGRLLTYNGITKNMSAWEAELGLKRNVIKARIDSGWTTEEAISGKRNKVSVSGMARDNGVSIGKLSYRIGAGWPSDRLFIERIVSIEYLGKKMTVAELSKKCGVTTSAIYSRLKNGWSVERIVETPVRKKSSQPMTEIPEK